MIYFLYLWFIPSPSAFCEPYINVPMICIIHSSIYMVYSFTCVNYHFVCMVYAVAFCEPYIYVPHTCMICIIYSLICMIYFFGCSLVRALYLCASYVYDTYNFLILYIWFILLYVWFILLCMIYSFLYDVFFYVWFILLPLAFCEPYIYVPHMCMIYMIDSFKCMMNSFAKRDL